jgi:2-keto-3-deoxy-L-rhamnonate aldolase RhmA
LAGVEVAGGVDVVGVDGVDVDHVVDVVGHAEEDAVDEAVDESVDESAGAGAAMTALEAKAKTARILCVNFILG